MTPRYGMRWKWLSSPISSARSKMASTPRSEKRASGFLVGKSNAWKEIGNIFEKGIGLFLLIIGLICLYISFKDGLRFSWLVISAAVLFLSVRMFASSNEV